MKKTITLCLFAFAMILGTQSVMAQSQPLETKLEINAKASEKTEALRRYVKFNNDQRDKIYVALRTYGEAKASLVGEAPDPQVVAKIEKQLEEQVKAVLNDEQYERYKSFSEE